MVMRGREGGRENEGGGKKAPVLLKANRDCWAECLQPAQPCYLLPGQRSRHSHTSLTQPLRYLDPMSLKPVDSACAEGTDSLVCVLPGGVANPGGDAVGGGRTVLLGRAGSRGRTHQQPAGR